MHGKIYQQFFSHHYLFASYLNHELAIRMYAPHGYKLTYASFKDYFIQGNLRPAAWPC